MFLWWEMIQHTSEPWSSALAFLQGEAKSANRPPWTAMVSCGLAWVFSEHRKKHPSTQEGDFFGFFLSIIL